MDVGGSVGNVCHDFLGEGVLSTRQEAGKQVGHRSVLKMQSNIVSLPLDCVLTGSNA